MSTRASMTPNPQRIKQPRANFSNLCGTLLPSAGLRVLSHPNVGRAIWRWVGEPTLAGSLYSPDPFPIPLRPLYRPWKMGGRFSPSALRPSMKSSEPKSFTYSAWLPIKTYTAPDRFVPGRPRSTKNKSADAHRSSVERWIIALFTPSLFTPELPLMALACFRPWCRGLCGLNEALNFGGAAPYLRGNHDPGDSAHEHGNANQRSDRPERTRGPLGENQ
jgi:hypothetical protein